MSSGLCCRVEGGTCSGDFKCRSSPLYLCAYCCSSTIILIIVILITVSFEYVHYHEMAFPKNSLSNKVDTSKIYSTGRHMVGPTVSMVRFPKQYQMYAFSGASALSVFNDEGQDILVDVFFQYRIKEDMVQNLMETFGTNYEGKLVSVVESTIKGVATDYDVSDYITNRTKVSFEFNRNVTHDLAEMFLDLESHKLQLGNIVLPNTNLDKLMQDAVVRQDAMKYDYEQEAIEVRAETDKQVDTIGANTTRVRTVSEVQASAIVESSQAEADRILAEAYGNGWIDAMAGLGIVDQPDQAEFLRLMGILDNPTEPQLIQNDLNVIIQAGRRLVMEKLDLGEPE